MCSLKLVELGNMEKVFIFYRKKQCLESAGWILNYSLLY